MAPVPAPALTSVPLLDRPFGPIVTPRSFVASHRVVKGLKLAWETTSGRKASRSRGNRFRLEGHRYEKKVGSLLPKTARQGIWFNFTDSNGLGLCQPDWIVPLGKFVLIVECKRTECPEATTQLTQLYFPVVGKALGLVPIGLVVAQHLTLMTPLDRIFEDFGVALNAAQCGSIPILHWLGP